MYTFFFMIETETGKQKKTDEDGLADMDKQKQGNDYRQTVRQR